MIRIFCEDLFRKESSFFNYLSLPFLPEQLLDQPAEVLPIDSNSINVRQIILLTFR